MINASVKYAASRTRSDVRTGRSSDIMNEREYDTREETMEQLKAGRAAASPNRSRRWGILLGIGLSMLLGIVLGVWISGGAPAWQSARVLTVSQEPKTLDEPMATALALSEAFARVARMVEPAVVHIETESARRGQRSEDPFDFFFGPRSRPRRGTGSGVIVDPQGYILTNHHVIQGASVIRVKTFDGTTYTPEVIGVDPETDLAVIKISRREPFPYARMGDSNKLRVGDWVLAIGSPFGLEQTVTAGIISAKDRVTDGENAPFQRFLQTDAAINPGNSGGPLINLLGEVVGINTQISTSTGYFNGVGFALPSSLAIEVYNQLIRRGRVARGYLGVYVKPVTPPVARMNGLKELRGALIESVTSPESPAAQAGLQAGDIIVEVDGEPIRDSRDLTRRVASMEVGRTVRLKYIRDGREYITSVKLGIRPSPADRSERLPEPEPQGEEKRSSGPPRLGATLEPVTPHVADVLKLGSVRGALVGQVEEESFAETLGLLPGDVILSINRREIRDPEDVRKIFEGLKSGDDVVMIVARAGRGFGPDRTVLSGTIP